LEPTGFHASHQTRTGATLEWEGQSATPTGIRYLLQYRAKRYEAAKWQEMLIERGLSATLTGLVPGVGYEYRLRRLCDGRGKRATLMSDWVLLAEAPTAGRFSLPPFDVQQESQALLMRWRTTYADTVATKTAECEAIRTEMRQLVSDLEYPPILIFGPNDDYLKQGMWRKFTAPPVPMDAQFDAVRNPKTVLLEHRHVDLYYCDKALEKAGLLKVKVDGLLQTETLEAVIRDRLANLNAEQMPTCGADPDAIWVWLRGQLCVLLEGL
jgi:hypothetical protein